MRLNTPFLKRWNKLGVKALRTIMRAHTVDVIFMGVAILMVSLEVGPFFPSVILLAYLSLTATIFAALIVASFKGDVAMYCDPKTEQYFPLWWYITERVEPE